MANTVTELMMRRMGNKGNNYLEGWKEEMGLNNNGVEIAQSYSFLSPYFYNIQGLSIKFKVWATARSNVVNAIEVFDADNAVVTRRNSNITNGEIILNNIGGESLRIVCKIDDIDYCYIYDRTNSRYIWAGRNVDTSIAQQ